MQSHETEVTVLVIVVIICEVESGETPERWVGRTDQMLFTLKHTINQSMNRLIHLSINLIHSLKNIFD